jgi:hypothetical protein
VDSSPAVTFFVLYMIVRARIVRPYHRCSGSRRWAGTFCVSSGESTRESRPARAAFHRLPASTVMSTSAGVRSPSAFRRSKSSPVLPLKIFTGMPVFFVKASKAPSWP